MFNNMENLDELMEECDKLIKNSDKLNEKYISEIIRKLNRMYKKFKMGQNNLMMTRKEKEELKALKALKKKMVTKRNIIAKDGLKFEE